MLWFLYTILAMLFRTSTNLLNKNLLKDIDSLTLGAVASLFTTLVYGPIFLFSIARTPLAAVSSRVTGAILASGFFNSIGLYLLLRALKRGDVSVVIPLRNLGPVFTLVWGILLLGETISPLLIPATLLIVAGATLLHIDKGLKLNLSDEASLFALGAAFFFSLAIIADKYVTGFMQPIRYVFFIFLLRFVFLSLFMQIEHSFQQTKELASDLINNYWRPLFFIAFFSASGAFLLFTSLSLAKVTLVAPALRIEVLFSALAGGYFFKEKNMKLKLTGATMLVIGLILVVS